MCDVTDLAHFDRALARLQDETVPVRVKEPEWRSSSCSWPREFVEQVPLLRVLRAQHQR